jgi:hypothetical protein
MFRILKFVSGVNELVETRWSSRIVQESAQGSIVQTAGYRVQQRIEGGRVRDALHRERLDIACSQEAKLDAIYGRGSRLMGVHGGASLSFAPIFWRSRAQRRLVNVRNSASLAGSFFRDQRSSARV